MKREIRLMDRLVPNENVEVFAYLYVIETALRELIIEELGAVAKGNWHKTRLPSDLLKKYREAREIERKTKWMELIPHHPIYYVDFPDLKKIIDRTDNWNDVFQKIFHARIF